MKSFFSSYSHKLLAFTLLISIIPILLFGNIMYMDEINREIDSVKTQLIISSENKALHISEWIDERKIYVHDIAENSIVISSTKKLLNTELGQKELFEAKVALEKQLSIVHQNHLWLQDLRLSDPYTGETLFYTGVSHPNYNLLHQKHFRDAIQGITSSSDIFPSLEILKNEFGTFEKGIPTMLISSPIKGEVGLQAILTARVDVFEIIDYHDPNVNDNFITQDSYLINSNGMLLSKPKSFSNLWEFNLIDTRPELELSIKNQFSDDVFFNILNSEISEIGWNEGFENFIGEKVVGVVVPVEGTNWHYMTEIHHNEAFYEAKFLEVILLSLIGVTLLLVTGASLFFSSKLTLPIKNLIKVTEQIKKGNLKVNVKTCGSDEIHDLAVSVNSMAKSLNKSKKTKHAVLKKYHDIYENSPLMHRTIDMNGKITNCNKAYADAFGYTKYEIIGKSVFDFVPTEHRELLEDSFSDWKKTGIVRNREIILRKKDGNTFPALLSANNLYDENGKRIGSNTIMINMTDIRKKESEIEDLKQKRLSAIGELTARIAHDMRNPLSVIKNTADIIKMEQISMDEDSLKNWERLERGIYRIKHQVEDVLDYVKITPFKKQPEKLLRILQDAVERVEIPKNITLLLPQENPKINCDSEKIETVFVNLIMNAIQAIGQKTGKISISVEDQSLDYFKIKVEDSGPGIHEHLISKIFDPLFTTRQIGTGLGLPSCKNIIENHGGTIETSSPPGKGAIFEIVLPKRTEWDQVTSEYNKKSIQKS